MKLWETLIRNSWSEPPFWSLDAPPIRLSPWTSEREQVEHDFASYVHSGYKRNGVVFACMLVRSLVFSEARFQYRRFENGRPTDLFGDPSLALLERPWPNGTTGELLVHMEQDASLAGTFFATTVGEGAERRIRRLRPDWMTILTGSRSGGGPFAVDAEIAGYVYQPPNQDPTVLARDEVVQYSPIPDPAAQWRGMSWLTPILNEVQGDTAAMTHKLNFFKRGATPGIAVTYDPTLSQQEVKGYIDLFNEEFDGKDNAYRTLHMGGGADVKPMTADLKQLDFKVTQGHGETRIAAAAGVHPVIVGLSEGMQGSALNAGNYGQVRRRFADGTVRPLWRSAAASLETIVDVPDGAHLWYDDRDVAFLRQDAKDAAEIMRIRTGTLNALISNGWTPESAVAALEAEDLTDLEHSGLLSVQLQAPGEESDDPVSVPTNLVPRLLSEGWTMSNGHKQEVTS